MLSVMPYFAERPRLQTISTALSKSTNIANTFLLFTIRIDNNVLESNYLIYCGVFEETALGIGDYIIGVKKFT